MNVKEELSEKAIESDKNKRRGVLSIQSKRKEECRAWANLLV
jgi:hypothetical protein